MYPKEVVQPMIEDLLEVGFKELETPQQVEDVMKESGTMLVFVNSVCGCSARNARPAAKISLMGDKRPDKLYTVFAGYNIESTAKAREFMLPFPPSSPSIALFKDGQLVHMLERHHIEGRPAEIIAENLTQAYEDFC